MASQRQPDEDRSAVHADIIAFYKSEAEMAKFDARDAFSNEIGDRVDPHIYERTRDILFRFKKKVYRCTIDPENNVPREEREINELREELRGLLQGHDDLVGKIDSVFPAPSGAREEDYKLEAEWDKDWKRTLRKWGLTPPSDDT